MPHPFRPPGPLVLGILAVLLGCATAALADAGKPGPAAGILLLAGLAGAALVLKGVSEDLTRRPEPPSPEPPRTLEGAEALAEANRRSAGGESSFRLEPLREGEIRLIGAFDLDASHDVELTFHAVRESNCPEELRWPHFADDGPIGAHRRYLIEDDGGRYEVVAAGVSVALGKVYHSRRKVLRPGERMRGDPPA